MSVFTLCLLGSCLRDVTPGHHVGFGLMGRFRSYWARASFKANLFGHGKQWWRHLQFGPLCEVWWGGLAFISEFHSQTLFATKCLTRPLQNSQRFSPGMTEILLMLQEFQSCDPSPCWTHIFVFPSASCCCEMTYSLCEVTNGCHALWRPVKIKIKWNQRAAGR